MPEEAQLELLDIEKVTKRPLRDPGSFEATISVMKRIERALQDLPTQELRVTTVEFFSRRYPSF